MHAAFRLSLLGALVLLAACTQDRTTNMAQGAGLGAASGFYVGGFPGALAGTAVGAVFGQIATPRGQR